MGLGLGLVMQVLVLAVQNAVDYAELGVATSGATLFRSMGGSLGTAVLGAIFTNRLTSELAGTPAAQVGSGSIDPSAVERLPGRGPRRLHRRLHRLALDRLPRRGGDRPRRLPALVADRGAAAAPDGRDGRRGRGVRVAHERRLAEGAHARARPARRARAHARVHRAHGRRRRGRPAAGRGVAARAGSGGAARCTTPRRSPTAARSTRPSRERCSPGSPSAAWSTGARAHAGRARHGHPPDRRAPRLPALADRRLAARRGRAVNDAVARLARELAREVPALPR